MGRESKRYKSNQINFAQNDEKWQKKINDEINK